MALTLDAQLKVLATLVTLSFGAVLLTTRGDRRAQRILALFLLLIAANQACESARALLPDGRLTLQLTALAMVFAALDPAVLVWFAATRMPADRRLRFALASTTVFSAALALWAGFAAAPRTIPGPDPAAVVLTGYTGIVYLGLAAIAARPAMAEGKAGTATLEFAAYAVVALPVLTSFGEWINYWAGLNGQITYDVPTLFSDLAILGVTTGIVALAAGWARPPRLLVVIGLALTLAIIIDSAHIARGIAVLSGLEPNDALRVLGRSAAPIRWLIFSTLMSVAVVRHDAFALTQAQRRRAARVFLALGILSVGGLATAALSILRPIPARPIETTLLIVLVLASQGFRRWLDELAWILYGVPIAGDIDARHAAYREAASQAILRGTTPARDADLQHLREELEIDGLTAAAIERVADAGIDAPLSAGQLVAGRYRIERALARGGSGRVFCAHDGMLDRHVVLKEVLCGSPTEEDMVLREARLAASVADPHVVTVHDVLTRRGAVLIITEQVEGGTLDDLLARGRPTPAECERILDGVLRGLSVVHAYGIVHGDLKPANVLLTPGLLPKIADFGISHLTAADTMEMARPADIFVGTPGFVAPELLHGGPPTLSSDVYAAGLLAKRLRPSGTPLEMAAIARALAEDPRRRYADGGEFLDALAEARFMTSRGASFDRRQ